MFNIELKKIGNDRFQLEKTLLDGTVVVTIEGSKKLIIEAALEENITHAEKILDTLEEYPANYFSSSTNSKKESSYVH